MDIYSNYANKMKCKSFKKMYYEIWFNKLISYVSRIFIYENLPANLPQWEIEQRLILAGRAAIFNTELYGLVTAWGGFSGVNIYDRSNHFNFAQAVLGSENNLSDNIDGVIMYGSSIDESVNTNIGMIGKRIGYYADILSDVDVSRRIALINNRAVNSVSAKSDNALKELKEFYKQLYDGSPVIPKITSGVLDSTENILKGVNQNAGFSLADFDTATQNTLKLFWSDFGVSYGESKRERMLSEEVKAEQDALDISIYDMLECRKDGVNRVNCLYGTSIRVTVNNKIIT